GELSEGDAPDPRQLVHQLGHSVGDSGSTRMQMVGVDSGFGLRGEGAHERIAQIERADPRQEIGGEIQVSLVEARSSGEGQRRLVVQVIEQLGRIFERLGFDETSQEKISFLPQCELIVEVYVFVVRKQAAGLQLDQGRRYEQELR